MLYPVLAKFTGITAGVFDMARTFQDMIVDHRENAVIYRETSGAGIFHAKENPLQVLLGIPVAVSSPTTEEMAWGVWMRKVLALRPTDCGERKREKKMYPSFLNIMMVLA